MLVHFTKTGSRRYGVLVERDSGPDVIADPAPGYDDYLPHDLLHFVAEAECGIDGAVFGQLAAGGDPGIFLPVEEELVDKWVRRRKLRKKAQTQGRRAEALVGVLDSAWKAQTGKAPLPEWWNLELTRARVEPEQLASVVASIDVLASRWHKLQVGGSITLPWPRPEGRARRRPTAPRRSTVATARRRRGSRTPSGTARDRSTPGLALNSSRRGSRRSSASNLTKT
ncbi:MAG TPA: hypothetical protein VH281_03985 [Gaiellaceae bacterium]